MADPVIDELPSLVVIRAVYEVEAGVWITASSDLPGLLLEAVTLEELQQKVPGAVLDLVEAAARFEGRAPAAREIAIEIIAHAHIKLRVGPAA